MGADPDEVLLLDTSAAIALVATHRPDVVVLDPRLPELPDGIALIRRIRAIHPGVRILEGLADLEARDPKTVSDAKRFFFIK